MFPKQVQSTNSCRRSKDNNKDNNKDNKEAEDDDNYQTIKRLTFLESLAQAKLNDDNDKDVDEDVEVEEDKDDNDREG